MAIVVLVGFWLLVGLTVFLAAMRGGRKRVPASGAPAKRTSPAARNSMIAASAVVLVFFGGVLPAWALVHNNRDQAKQSKGGLVLTADQEKGRALFRANCATCHTLDAAKTVGKVGTNLDVLRPNEALILDAINNGRGQGQMPLQLLQGIDAKNVAKYVAAVAGR